MKTYQLTVNEKQLQVIGLACECYGRIQYGQPDHVIRDLPLDLSTRTNWRIFAVALCLYLTHSLLKLMSRATVSATWHLICGVRLYAKMTLEWAVSLQLRLWRLMMSDSALLVLFFAL